MQSVFLADFDSHEDMLQQSSTFYKRLTCSKGSACLFPPPVIWCQQPFAIIQINQNQKLEGKYYFTSQENALLLFYMLEAGRELDAWGLGCPPGAQGWALLHFCPLLPKHGRELTHFQDKDWFVVELADFGQVSGDRGFGQSAT